jgi:hypothetical protein
MDLLGLATALRSDFMYSPSMGGLIYRNGSYYSEMPLTLLSAPTAELREVGLHLWTNHRPDENDAKAWLNSDDFRLGRFPAPRINDRALRFGLGTVTDEATGKKKKVITVRRSRGVRPGIAVLPLAASVGTYTGALPERTTVIPLNPRNWKRSDRATQESAP